MTQTVANLSSVSPKRLRQIVHCFQNMPVLVVGDIMLDRFIHGRATRLSPEAPVPILRFTHETLLVGGAGNVARNLAALGAKPSLVGVTGADSEGHQVVTMLRENGVTCSGVVADNNRPTTVKTRLVTTTNHHVARIDYEANDPVSGDLELRLIRAAVEQAWSSSAIVISDYAKGSITKNLVSSIQSVTPKRPIVIDPKIPNIELYRGATVITPNNLEAEQATGTSITTDAEAKRAARVLRDRTGCDAALITRGEQGMWLSSDTDEGPIRAVAREVVDVSGAGDTVVAVAALVLGMGGTLVEAAMLANTAAGLVVRKFGPATVSVAELVQSASPMVP